MPTMGDLLGAARHSAPAFRRWIGTADPDLARRIEQAAAQSGLSEIGFVRVAVADFSRHAGEEDWATLVSGLRDSEDPGTYCLLAMVHWRLTASACAEHRVHAHEERTA